MEKFNRPPICKLSNLKHLELIVDATGAGDLLCLMSILKACPALYVLKLKLNDINASLRGKIKVKKAKCSHQSLKVLELSGFVGSRIEKELVLDMLSQAVSLKVLVIDPCSSYIKTSKGDWICEVKPSIRACAGKLQTKLPPGLDLVVL